MAHELTFRAPANVYLFGAGRWARVILSVLLDRLPKDVKLVVISARHAATVEQWLAARQAPGRATVLDHFPGDAPGGAAIVANAVRDHARSAETALRQGIPVLVEKPLAESAAEIERLSALASEHHTFLGAAHVLLFAEYLPEFAAVVRSHPRPAGIRLVWSDAANENRHGEPKTFDVTVPVFLDVLPHVVSILRTVWPSAEVTYRGLHVTAVDEVSIDASVDGVPCTVNLSRNRQMRERLLEVVSPAGAVALDFSVEPGTISSAGSTVSADPDWRERPGPLTQQLQSFLAGAVDGVWDHRLSPQLASEAAVLSDRALADYRQRPSAAVR